MTMRPRTEAILQEKINVLTDLASGLCDELHNLKVSFNFTRIAMTDDTARAQAFEIVREVEGKIDVARAVLATTLSR